MTIVKLLESLAGYSHHNPIAKELMNSELLQLAYLENKAERIKNKISKQRIYSNESHVFTVPQE